MSSDYRYLSPLRYPGGKAKISSFIEDIILLNNLEGCTFYELYAGGAGASLHILLKGLCKNIIINDLDYHIYAFWYSILNNTEDVLKRIRNIEVNLKNWHIQNQIYENYTDYDILDVAFSTFFLNRTNRSGILHRAGPIGGKNQSGNYKLDVRFNKSALANRIEKIAQNKDKILLFNCESK